jgi:hypothetical protein
MFGLKPTATGFRKRVTGPLTLFHGEMQRGPIIRSNRNKSVIAQLMYWLDSIVHGVGDGGFPCR